MKTIVVKKMRRYKEIAVRCFVGFQYSIYTKVKEMKMRKSMGGKEVIVEFVLMVVAVAVGFIFRDQIQTLISSLGTAISGKINDMFNT